MNEQQDNSGAGLDATIRGYVTDNMEGAVDQATFLAATDIPVAVVGARGTGKMYVAKVVHQESRHAAGEVIALDCRELRRRDESNKLIRRALEQAGGGSLVFKSPHLMQAEVQNRLARQLSTRTLADTSPPRYLPDANYIALFPESIERLLQKGELSARLASVFAGFPIYVPPIRDRKQAVLRWANKILLQECSDRGRTIRGFTPEAEKAMLNYAWPGNIDEMRQRINTALDAAEGEWLSPVELGIYDPQAGSRAPDHSETRAYLDELQPEQEPAQEYRASPFEALDTALGGLVNELVTAGTLLPLGQWLADEIVLSARQRYRDNNREVAEFLHTRPRNISRWLPQIEEREAARDAEPEPLATISKVTALV